MSDHSADAANSSWRADDGPVVELPDDTTPWYRKGRLYREDGALPASRSVRARYLREALEDKPLTDPQRKLLDALSENWEGTVDSLYETVLALSQSPT